MAYGLGILSQKKGEFAEAMSIPRLVAGTMQNMYRTVTDVESYQHIIITEQYATDMLKHIRGFCLRL